MNIAVVGIGLIGGSMALDLKRQINVKVCGVDKSAEHCDEALSLGLVEEILNIDTAIKWADIIIVGIPVSVMETTLNYILDRIDNKKTVIDVGSTKESILSSVKGHHKRGRFVAAHPLAGTEFSGPRAAFNGLFEGKKNNICDKEQTDDDALQNALTIFDSMGMDTIFMSGAEHDKHIAYVSHLSHVTSFTLGLTVLDIEKDEKHIFNLASTGFASTVRLAKSNPDTWTSIFQKNNQHLVVAIEQYIAYLKKFKIAIKTEDTETIYEMIQQANIIKKTLK